MWIPAPALPAERFLVTGGVGTAPDDKHATGAYRVSLAAIAAKMTKALEAVLR